MDKKDIAACEHAIRALACLGSEESVEKAVRQRVVHPQVQSFLSEQLFRDADPTVLTKTFDALYDSCMTKLSVVVKCEIPGFTFHFIQNSLWAEVQDTLLRFNENSPA